MQPNEEYENLIDDAFDDNDTSHDLQDSQLAQYEAATYPQQNEKSDLFAWFWKVTRLKKPFELIRTGNLSKHEIGDSKVSIRDSMHLSQLSEVCGHDLLAKYFRNFAGVTSASSMSHKGWFMDLSISQKRVRERTKHDGMTPERKKLFSRGKNKSPANEE